MVRAGILALFLQPLSGLLLLQLMAQWLARPAEHACTKLGINAILHPSASFPLCDLIMHVSPFLRLSVTLIICVIGRGLRPPRRSSSNLFECTIFGRNTDLRLRWLPE